jgi:hypothetical protein
VFERSAEQAGYFEHGKNRLVMPAVAIRDPLPPADDEADKNKQKNGGGDGGGVDDLELDPLLIALLKKIPATVKG